MSDKISLIRWRDSKADPPMVDEDERLLLGWEDGAFEVGRFSRNYFRGMPKGTTFFDQPTRWAEPPDVSQAVSREDIETVLEAAESCAKTLQLPELNADFGLAGLAVFQAVARIRTALGGEEQ